MLLTLLAETLKNYIANPTTSSIITMNIKLKQKCANFTNASTVLLLSFTYAFTPCSWALHMQPQFTLEFYICTHKLPKSFTYATTIHSWSSHMHPQFALELHICIHNCPRALHMQPQFALELFIYAISNFTYTSTICSWAPHMHPQMP